MSSWQPKKILCLLVISALGIIQRSLQSSPATIFNTLYKRAIVESRFVFFKTPWEEIWNLYGIRGIQSAFLRTCETFVLIIPSEMLSETSNEQCYKYSVQSRCFYGSISGILGISTIIVSPCYIDLYCIPYFCFKPLYRSNYEFFGDSNNGVSRERWINKGTIVCIKGPSA